ncbi:TetR/AcrR family transcriptional regulator [Hylemonella gracilis]|uniref:TetR/AcrR family transcriptional regulator n=1 Tax=Hylemonella gracilis TaxID=80880 RepID=UPI000553E7DA|nr:TetR/AcrR family transcriptional regulator [Hylemonella gracilis]
MPLAPSRKQLTHDRIVDAAARALRGGGFAGVGVADIMKQSGLTHGGFYAHFASRDALIAEALERAGHDAHARMQQALDEGEARGVSRFRTLVDNYLSERHLSAPEHGCAVAALASEMPRQADALREAAVARVRELVADVRKVLPASQPEEAAGVIAGQLIGALQIARTLGPNAQGRKHLAVARRFLLAQFEPNPVS